MQSCCLVGDSGTSVHICGQGSRAPLLALHSRGAAPEKEAEYRALPPHPLPHALVGLLTPFWLRCERLLPWNGREWPDPSPRGSSGHMCGDTPSAEVGAAAVSGWPLNPLPRQYRLLKEVRNCWGKSLWRLSEFSEHETSSIIIFYWLLWGTPIKRTARKIWLSVVHP